MTSTWICVVCGKHISRQETVFDYHRGLPNWPFCPDHAEYSIDNRPILVKCECCGKTKNLRLADGLENPYTRMAGCPYCGCSNYRPLPIEEIPVSFVIDIKPTRIIFDSEGGYKEYPI